MSDQQKTATFYPEIYQLRPWYHNFDKLGLQTDFGDMKMSRREQLRRLFLLLSPRKPAGFVEKGEKLSLRSLIYGSPNSHQINQRHKETYLIPFLKQALADLPPSPRCLDLFCADGYYSCWIGQQRPDALITGVDLDEKEIERAQTAAAFLNIQNATFYVENIWNRVEKPDEYHLIICAGGLYHLTNPQKLLAALPRIAAGYLVIQSAVTLETEEPDYFVAPAPGWKHGSRFTHAGLKKWLTESGWIIEAEGRNELTGNPRLCDRGSSYFLCRWET
ncbi:MAG TPA: methyltransferase domain-containing protein [Anaerolineae bacterium]|nr:methyltransferase domain-containing protein [Anaerolineae bacterium]